MIKINVVINSLKIPEEIKLSFLILNVCLGLFILLLFFFHHGSKETKLIMQV